MESTKEHILQLTRQYYKEHFQVLKNKQQNFKPGDRISYAGRFFDENELVSLIDSSLEFWLTSGRYTDEFEKMLASFVGTKWSYLVNSGSSANLLAFYALTSPLLKERSVKRGDEIITLACGFPTTVAPIIQYGCVPVFVDVDEHTLNIDTTQLEAALSSKTKAIMIAHTLGNPFNIKLVKEFCNKHQLWLIEDNCDALGSTYELDGVTKYTGSFGDVATSSFYPPHHLTMGEGGAVYTNSSVLKRALLSLRDWGRDCYCPSGKDNTCGKRYGFQLGNLPKGYDHKYIYSHFGFNLKATDMQAAIGVEQLKKLPSFISKRRENWDFLFAQAKSRGWEEYFTFQKPTENSAPSWFGFCFTLKDNKSKFTRGQIVSHLEENNIQTRMLFGGNLIKHPCFDSVVENVDYRVVGDLRNTNNIMENTFWIGMYPGLDQVHLQYIIDSIDFFLKKT